MSKNLAVKSQKKLHLNSYTKEKLLELQNTRIIQKNLVHVIGISEKLCDNELLSKKEYFGQYGKIIKICVNSKKAYDPYNKHGPSFSVFVTFLSNHEAALAITLLDNFYIHGHVIRAAYGSNKYCVHFLKNIPCSIKDCMFIHTLADAKDILNKKVDGMLKSKFYEVNQERALTILKDLPSVVKSKIYETKSSPLKTVFPSLKLSFIKMKIDDLQKNNKPNIKNVNIPFIGLKCDKNEFKEDILPKNEKCIKEIYISELSSSTLNISTDNLSSRREKKFSLFQSRDKSRFKFADSINQINFVPETISNYISLKTSTHFHLRNVNIDIISGLLPAGLKEWENLTMLNDVTHNYN